MQFSTTTFILLAVTRLSASAPTISTSPELKQNVAIAMESISLDLDLVSGILHRLITTPNIACNGEQYKTLASQGQSGIQDLVIQNAILLRAFTTAEPGIVSPVVFDAQPNINVFEGIRNSAGDSPGLSQVFQIVTSWNDISIPEIMEMVNRVSAQLKMPPSGIIPQIVNERPLDIFKGACNK